jgi:hypothetical protein
MKNDIRAVDRLGEFGGTGQACCHGSDLRIVVAPLRAATHHGDFVAALV